MKQFELTYLCLEPFLPPLYRGVRRRLVQIAQASELALPEVLDVGGRKSHYTIGVPGRVTITDLPRETPLQRELNLGIDERMMAELRRRRSNVRDVLLDDMTHSALPDASFDCVVSVEVLEHVEDDHSFVREVSRVLRPGGVFVMTTPNGDSVPNDGNPDHKRHYTREQLRGLLTTYFATADVEYAVRNGRLRILGNRSWSVRHPVRTAVCMAANVVNGIQSAAPALKDRAADALHLIAVARKRDGRRAELLAR
jgi:SAM-dependent methyltransferase